MVATKARRRVLAIAAGFSIALAPVGVASAEPNTAGDGASDSVSVESGADTDTSTDTDSTPADDDDSSDSSDSDSSDSDSTDSSVPSADPTPPSTDNTPNSQPGSTPGGGWSNDGTNHWPSDETSPDQPEPQQPAPEPQPDPAPPEPAPEPAPPEPEPEPVVAPEVDTAEPVVEPAAEPEVEQSTAAPSSEPQSDAPRPAADSAPCVPTVAPADTAGDTPLPPTASAPTSVPHESFSVTALSARWSSTTLSFAAPAPTTTGTNAVPAAAGPLAVSLSILAFLGLPGNAGTPANPALWTVAWFVRRVTEFFDDLGLQFDDADGVRDGKTFHIVVDAVGGPVGFAISTVDGQWAVAAQSGYIGADDGGQLGVGESPRAAGPAQPLLQAIMQINAGVPVADVGGTSASTSDGTVYRAARNVDGDAVVYRIASCGTVSTVDTLDGAPIGSPAVGADGSVYQTTQRTNEFGQLEIDVFTMTPGLTIENTVSGGAAVGGVVVDGNTAYQRTESSDGESVTTTVTVINRTGINRSYSRQGRSSQVKVRDGAIYTTLDAATSTGGSGRIWVISPTGVETTSSADD